MLWRVNKHHPSGTNQMMFIPSCAVVQFPAVAYALFESYHADRSSANSGVASVPVSFEFLPIDVPNMDNLA